jgi:3-oxoacyl-[acyl-carrier-protein] synthase II
MTSPPDDGGGGRRAMALAIRQANVATELIGHVKAIRSGLPATWK